MRIALDVGNILVRVNFSKFIEAVMRNQTDLKHGDAFKFLEFINHGLDVGMYTMRQAIEELLLESEHARYKTADMVDTLVQAWMTCAIPVKEMTEFLETTHHEIALLSNIGYDHAKLLESIPAFNKHIKHFSCEVGARKPSKLYYQSFLLEHPEFKGCLYIDDVDANLNMGAKMGLTPLKFDLSTFDNDKKAVENLERIIVENDPYLKRRYTVTEF